ncbi:MAG: hypothetical protein ABMA26_25385 [Limisphaerales bacterium]
MNRLLLCTLLFALPLTACKRKPSSTSTAPEAPAAPPNPEVDLKALNEAVRAHIMGLLKEPATLEELVKTGFIKRLPAAPPGKKYVLDPKKASVLLVDQ